MSAFPDYLLKLSVGLAVIALFYHWILRKLTFYDANRYYLRWYSMLCLSIPFININQFVSPEPSPARVFVQSVPALTHRAAPETAAFPMDLPGEPVAAADSWPLSATDWMLHIWLAGVAVMTLRLLAHIRSYLRIRSQSRLTSNDGVKIFHFDLDMSPFSFGKAIFYNPHLHKPDELQDMILHEYIHVQQWHSLDVIWSEILCIINWFNPFAWLIRSAIRQNLEYIADQKVLENHPDTKAYQYLLLKAAIGPEFSLVNQFGYHSLKQRIVMMNKNASPKALLACFLFILPLLAVMLAAFRWDVPRGKKVKNFYRSSTEVSKRKPQNLLHLSGLLLDAETRKPVSNLPLKITHDGVYIETIKTDKDGFYFIELPVKPEAGVSHEYNYELLNGEGGYLGFISGEVYHGGFTFGETFPYHFLKKSTMPELQPKWYGVSSKPFYDRYNLRDIRPELKAFLLENAEPLKEEMKLRTDYIQTHRWSKDVITLYKGGYFDRKKNLLGYDGDTKLFLNGKEATPREINEAFKNYPYMLTGDQERRNYGPNVCTEIVYLTFPLHRDAPPATLVKGNVEVKDAQSFEPARLKDEPYLLDGFRQVYGASSNLMPEKQDIKRVMLLKGPLAKYYDSSLNEIWWIETRPVNEVFERPDFASR
ncbi:MAG: M56 family metallopeptidase [Dyadobacter sp.]|uniref:M56 family metallopeptidase n=1 Tax=Dyadobacter sp. TaxID=1914288 RepID=UPI001B27F890|nr:M56 family metallopeptidase [Dyadobacter sp.]MBO9612936.1 M56 family metallopeptidase [Dyadobacter sp.]